ncbi:MAG: phage Gp37/Gp68 family protein [Prevotellaceae bacterium]|jgi:protein gp37|nr:phage Gp37/Gp68 family protein [Prevotellaceae bacterium]
MVAWNLWHGCHKYSEGCKNCYVYRGDAKRGKDSTIVAKTSYFDAPVKKNRKGEYKIPSGSTVYTCFSSDFFIKDADEWRSDAWNMIRERSDLNFLMITKRIERLQECVPNDWEEGYDNVTICCTMENQDKVDFRMPTYKNAPIKHKIIICEPLLEAIDLGPYLDSQIEQVVVGGESGYSARLCNFDWVMDIRQQCIEKKIPFWFKQTGAKFIKDGQLFKVARQFQHSQARKANINIKDYK